MWIPKTTVFTDREKAYAFYRSVCPKHSNSCYEDDDDTYDLCAFLEKDGTLDTGCEWVMENGNRIKRPSGAVIRAVTVTQ